ncbi:MAG: hypothetical protein CSB55_08160 [Candidatus Cloacimonadota bacterium]|nr:MAG: hypothetical protein CSB55_08160 [Candidatus Cloacimonadota bacterium]
MAKKTVKVLILLLFAVTVFADYQMPSIHTSIMLDSKFYSGNQANKGNYDNDNRFQVRKAAVEIEGEINEYLEYTFEFGLSTCIGKGAELKVMDAGIAYNLNENISFGLQQGHVLRGFASITDCRERLTIEKPIFQKTFGTCHPTGFVADAFFELSEYSDIEIELALLNGTNGTLTKEHDYNIGAIYNTPLPGLGFSGSYTMTNSLNYYDENYQQYDDRGYRANFGIRYEPADFHFSTEYYLGEGFQKSDQEMEAYYVQSGYAIQINHARLQYIEPYVMYEFWNKDKGSDVDSEYGYVNCGLVASLSEAVKLKFNYQEEIKHPGNGAVAHTPSSFIMRLQFGL